MSASKTAQKDKKGLNQPQKEQKETTVKKAVDQSIKDNPEKRYNLACSADPSHYHGTPKNFSPKWKCSKCGAPIIEVGNQSQVIKAPPTPPPIPQKGP